MKKLFVSVIIVILFFAGCAKKNGSSVSSQENSASQTIKERGITVDYSFDKPEFNFEIYIDGTKYYFLLNFYYENMECDIAFVNMKEDNNADVSQTYINGVEIINMMPDIKEFLSKALTSWNVETRDNNTITNIIIRELSEKYK